VIDPSSTGFAAGQRVIGTRPWHGGGSVVTRRAVGHWNGENTTESTATTRVLAPYRLAAGRIVVDDVKFGPELMQILGPIPAVPAIAPS